MIETPKHFCIHGLAVPDRLLRDTRGGCYCTFRSGDAGLINGQCAEFSGEKLLRYTRRPATLWGAAPPFILNAPFPAFDGRRSR